MKSFFKNRLSLKDRNGPLTKELRLAQNSAFGMVPERLNPERTLPSICGYCSTGCQLDIHMQGGEPVNLSASSDYPVNLGMACPKGWEALTPLKASDRGVVPLLRHSSEGQNPVSWEIAFETFTQRFKALQQKHGNEAVAWLGTGQITNEEMGLLGALAKFGMGWIHGDGNTRQCMASAVTAYKQSFGFDAPPYSYEDLEISETLVFIGANPAIAHPILWHRVMLNPNRPDIIVIDPRVTETSSAATLHLPIRPKSDLTLFYALAHLMIQEQWLDKKFISAHTSGFDSYARFVEPFNLECASRETGLEREVICDLARRIHESKAASFWWTMGVNQGYQGTRTAQSIINLALMTGNIGRPGTGANSITGQCNAMGSRLFSNTSSLFAGRNFENNKDRASVAGLLDIPVEHVPSQPSLPYDRIIDAVEAGEIKGLWIIATNPGHSWIDQSRWLRLLREKLEFLVVQDMYYSTETAREADLFLPAAGWGEKSGTFINSERRLGVIQSVATPPGEARSDFEIFKGIAEHWGCGEMFESWKSPEEAFSILKKLTIDQPCDISGVENYDMLVEQGGIQWPYSQALAQEGPAQPERRLYEDGRFFHEDGRARFIFEAVQSPPEPTDEYYSFWLITGRASSAQWHTQTRTAKSLILRELSPRCLYVDIHPQDATALGIQQEELVEIKSRRGRVRAVARVIAAVRPGQIFLPMHDSSVNQLTHPSFDPYSRQPSYKACAVHVQKKS